MYSVIPRTAWIISVLLNLAWEESPIVFIAVSITFDWCDSWCNWVSADVREHRAHYGSDTLERNRTSPLRPLFGGAVQKNVNTVVCVHVERHQSAGRWIIFGGICTFCNMLMSKSCKSQIARRTKGRWWRGKRKKKQGGKQSRKERNRRRLV